MGSQLDERATKLLPLPVYANKNRIFWNKMRNDLSSFLGDVTNGWQNLIKRFPIWFSQQQQQQETQFPHSPDHESSSEISINEQNIY